MQVFLCFPASLQLNVCLRNHNKRRRRRQWGYEELLLPLNCPATPTKNYNHKQWWVDFSFSSEKVKWTLKMWGREQRTNGSKHPKRSSVGHQDYQASTNSVTYEISFVVLFMHNSFTLWSFRNWFWMALFYQYHYKNC